jgi:hypothetical protein
MKQDRIIDSNKIHILSIKTIKGNIDADQSFDSKLIAGHKFNIEVNNGCSYENKIIGITIGIDIKAANEKKIDLPITGSYTHEVIFKIDNLEDFVDVVNENGETEYVYDVILVSTTISIAYSTIRGIIYNRTQSTSLGSVILPIIDPKEFATVKQ